MRKKLTVESVKAELELLAMGAFGGEVTIDPDGDWPTLPQMFHPEDIRTFVFAVKARYFTFKEAEESILFGLLSLPMWSNYETLAKEIVSERKRLNTKPPEGGREGA